MANEYPYPEHVKLEAVKQYSQVVGEFLEWMSTKGYFFGQFDESGHGYPVFKPHQELLAEFFDIDLDKIEEERRRMLDKIRQDNEDYAQRKSFVTAQIINEAVASTAMDREGDGQTIALGPVTVGDTISKEE